MPQAFIALLNTKALTTMCPALIDLQF